MTWAHEEFGSGLVVTSSMADTVMIHLAEQVAPGIDVIFLDTGYHFVETIGTRDAVQAVHNVNLINVTPRQTVAEQDAAWGKDLFARNPDQCCALRKVPPLGNALEGYAAWATGLRRADSPSRANTPSSPGTRSASWSRSPRSPRWTDEDVADYIEANTLMINPLLDDGYASIGCEPVHAADPGPDARAGRWAGLAKTECGSTCERDIRSARRVRPRPSRSCQPPGPPSGSPVCRRPASRPSPTRSPTGLAAGERVQVLDGDEVRPHLSAGLGYSKEARDINVRPDRLGGPAARLARRDRPGPGDRPVRGRPRRGP